MDTDRNDLHSVMTTLMDGHWEMAMRAAQSLELTDALWQLVPVVVAAGEQYDARTPVQIADATAAGQRLDEVARWRARDLAEQWRALADAVFDNSAVNEAGLVGLTPAQALADPLGILASVVDVPGMTAQLLPGLLPPELVSADELLYFQAYLQAVGQTSRTPMLLRALFVAAVSTFEPLVTRMMHLLLQRADPGTYPTLTTPELDAEARNLCFGPPERWRDVMINRFGVVAVAEAVDWRNIERLWQDRHVIAHRGGATDQRHSNKTGVEPGTVLNPTPEDVQAAIDDIGAARFGIVAAVWDHLSPGMGRRLAESGFPFQESLRAGRWRQAVGLARAQEALAADAAGIAVAKVNRWIAAEQGMGNDAIRDEVQQWNVSDLPEVFSLARLILLHDDERALALALQLLASGELTRRDIGEWPLFEGPRSAGRLAALTVAEPSTNGGGAP